MSMANSLSNKCANFFCKRLQFWFNLSSMTWSHVFLLGHSVYQPIPHCIFFRIRLVLHRLHC